MIRAVIIDDEKNNIENLQLLLQKHCPQVEVVAHALNAARGREIILQHQPSLVLLDIQMPGRSGFDMLQTLPHYTFEVIFVTAFDKYGIRAVKFAAIDYLLKPVDIDELKAAIAKVAEKQTQRMQNLQIENLMQLLQQQQKSQHRLALPSIKETRLVNTQDIVHCESSNVYTTFYLVSGEKLTVSRPIAEYDVLLKDYGFVRCHQSHLVNSRFVKSLLKEDNGALLLLDGTQVPVSRQRKDAVTKALAITVK